MYLYLNILWTNNILVFCSSKSLRAGVILRFSSFPVQTYHISSGQWPLVLPPAALGKDGWVVTSLELSQGSVRGDVQEVGLDRHVSCVVTG